ncbi:unnamed protein product [Polarella glacialis]|uniref:Origin recognition complex subunit 3 N-terminal domain-containing protein n=2 Tax=Polarella glacialis TaxID=89957 RepID=A0A813FNC1_POLGL|nr:unnamed protein product [Polarella glacialis]
MASIEAAEAAADAAASTAAKATAVERPPVYRFSIGGERPLPPELPAALGVQPRGWGCALLEKLTLDTKSSVGGGRLCSRWATEAAQFAGDSVRRAFESGLGKHLQSLNQGQLASNGDVPMVLALAGFDVEDNAATMSQVEQLVREQLPKSCTAMVGSNGFRNLSVTSRRICQQLTRGDGAERRSADFGGADGGEDEEDEELLGLPGAVAAADFAEWHRSRGAGPVVLLLSQAADSLSKDVFRDVLGFWGTVCGRASIPLLLVVGLQQLPQSRCELFDGAPLVSVVQVDTLRLFDASAVCNKLLEHLVEDAGCPWALPPEVVTRLRQSFLNSEHSVSQILRKLVLLCDEALRCSPFAPLCAERIDGSLTAAKLEHTFSKCFKEATARPRQLLMEALEKLGITGSAAQVYSQAVLWRRRLIDSLKVWEALLVAAQPTVGQEARIRRLCKLLEALWPVDDTQQASQEQRLHGMFGKVKELLNCLPREQVRKLLAELSSAARGLSAALQGKLKTLQAQADGASQTDDEIRTSLLCWLEDVRQAYWQPLSGHARDLFLAGLCCPQAVLDKVEVSLGSKTEDQHILQLANGTSGNGVTVAHSSMDDAAVMCRLLECHTGKAVKVADLWKAFTCIQGTGPSPSNVLKRRFGMALATLHPLGLHLPVSGKSDGDQSLSGWRVRKRHFGRVWLKPRCEPQEELYAAREAAAALARQVPSTELAVSANRESPEESSPPVVEAAQGHMARLPFARKLTRVDSGTMVTPPPKKQRSARFFMS